MKKVALILLIAILGLIVIGALFGDSKKAPDAVQEPTPEQKLAEVVAKDFIPGLQPVDVHLSLEERGFKVERVMDQSGITWNCTQEGPSVTYKAEVFGPEVEVLGGVRATVMADGANKTAEAGRDFLAYMCSLPYDGSKPEEAKAWLLENYDQETASTTIGTVRFTLHGPSVAYRLLNVEPVR